MKLPQLPQTILNYTQTVLHQLRSTDLSGIKIVRLIADRYGGKNKTHQW